MENVRVTLEAIKMMYEVKTATNRCECEDLRSALETAKEELNMKFCSSVIINKIGDSDE